MSVKTRITGTQGSGAKLVEAHVHGFNTARGKHAGLVSLTHPFLSFNPEFHPFLNDSFGTAMNQNIAFSGIPEIIHNGGSSVEWTGTAIQGTWNFADSTKITITNANNNDEASFAEEGATTIDMSGFTTLTGKVDLDTYDSNNNSIILQFDNAGVDVGTAVNVNDFIDTGDFTEQTFVIPKTNFGLTTQSLDGMTITITRTGGAKPTIKFDDIQWEQTGDVAVFKATTPLGTRFHVTELRIRIEDVISSVLTDGSMPNIDPGAILGVSSLINGIGFGRVQAGKTLFAVNLKNLGDFFATGSDVINITGNATNTGLTLVVTFPEAIVLEGGESENFLVFRISDNLSGLTRFTAAARGALEV